MRTFAACASWWIAAAVGAQTAASAPSIDALATDWVRAVEPKNIERTIRTLVGFGTRHVFARTDSATEGTGAARAWLRAEFERIAASSGGRLTVELQSATVACKRPGMPTQVPVVNVIATLRGTTDPTRIYVVGGHYDSRNGKGEDGSRPAPGANDDGSGTAVALEVCRVLATTPFPATIVFCAYDGEEQGLLGSQAHAQSLQQQDANVDAMLGCDVVGNTLGMDGVRYRDHVRCFSYAATGNDSSGRSVARAVTFAARHVPDFAVKLVYRGDRYGRGGDHFSFHEVGYPAVRLTEPREDYSRQHQDITERDGKPYADLPEFVDFDYAANVARVVVATLGELASAPPPPLALKAEGAKDRYDTLLTFALPPSAVGCEFVWRETTAADWQHVIPAAEANLQPAAGRDAERGRQLATLRSVCLDDVIVGVRAIAANGARSRAATPPEPERSQQRPRTQETGK